jgi:hypothetical protein
MAEKQTYVETYKRPYPEIIPELLPQIKHLNDEFDCIEARILKSGIVDRDGERLEFQDIRIYLKENEKGKKLSGDKS